MNMKPNMPHITRIMFGGKITGDNSNTLSMGKIGITIKMRNKYKSNVILKINRIIPNVWSDIYIVIPQNILPRIS